MKCQYCGAELPNGHFCTNCGKPVPAQPEAFQAEQQIPAPPQQTSPQPQQQTPNPAPQQPQQVPAQPQQPQREPVCQRETSSQQQTPARRQTSMQPQQAAAQRQETQKKGLKPGAVVAIVLGSLLAAALAVFLVLKMLGTSGASKPAEKPMTPEDQTRQLTQYAVSKEWLEDCNIEKADLTTDGNVEYYTQDFDNDGWPELVITAFDNQGKNALCLLYTFIDGEVQLWTSYGYQITDADARIVEMQLANKKDYSGFAVRFTVRAEEKYQYLSILQLENNHLTEETFVKDAECTTYLVNNGWDSLFFGTPIILFDETLMSSVTPEMLAALAQLYDPQNAPDETGMIKLVDGTVYAIEQAGLYAFADGEKQLLCKAPEGFQFAQGDRLYYDGGFYMLGSREPAEEIDETKEYQVFRVDISAGTAEPLFTVPGGVELLKADEQRIYAQTGHGDKAAFGEITVYDRQGTVIETLATPESWATDGKLVVGMDRKGYCSVVTADGQYLMENLPVKDVKLIDGSAYYLTSSDMSATLYRLTAIGKTITVGTVPSTEVSFRQRAGKWLVEVYDGDDQKTYYDLEKLEKVYSDAEIKAQIPAIDNIGYFDIDFKRDAVTGELYLLPASLPYGHNNSVYRVTEDNQFEQLCDGLALTSFWLFYNDMAYYGSRYMQSFTVVDCVPVAELPQFGIPLN